MPGPEPAGAAHGCQCPGRGRRRRGRVSAAAAGAPRRLFYRAALPTVPPGCMTALPSGDAGQRRGFLAVSFFASCLRSHYAECAALPPVRESRPPDRHMGIRHRRRPRLCSRRAPACTRCDDLAAAKDKAAILKVDGSGLLCEIIYLDGRPSGRGTSRRSSERQEAHLNGASAYERASSTTGSLS